MSAFFNKKNSHYIYLNKASCYRLFQLLKENKARSKNNRPPKLNASCPKNNILQEKSFNVQSDKTNSGGSS